MTTIAYRDGLVAADKRLCFNDTIVSDTMDKLVRLDDGRVAAITGDPCSAMCFIDWLQNEDGDRPSLKDTDVILFAPGDKITIHDENGVINLTEKFYADGSGRKAALAALHMDATAEDAVRVAAKVDPFTSPTTTFMRVGQ